MTTRRWRSRAHSGLTPAPAANGPLPGLISKSGIQRAALTALDPLSTQRLDDHVALPESLLLERLQWASTAQSQPVVPHAVVN